jgi:cephalosporin hydroxylase
MNHPYQSPGERYWTDGDQDVPVFQRPEELDQLLDRYRERKPRRVLEIGVYYGGTLKQWAQHARRGALVVGVDRFDIPRADPRERARTWARKGVRLELIEGDSGDPATVAQVQALGPFDWIMIDADHTLPAAVRDWTIYRTMAAPGAVVVFHDIVADPRFHPEIQVPELWRQIKAEGYRVEEIVHDYGAPWGGLGVVYL